VKHGEGLRAEASNAMERNPERKKNRRLRLPRRKAIFLAVHRHKNTVYYKRLNAGQFLLLSAFKDNATLAAACELLADSGLAGQGGVKSWFQTWAALGWFCKLE
jgi:hypothetical protein